MIYSFELYINYLDAKYSINSDIRYELAKKHGFDFDRRSKIDFINDFKQNSNDEIYPDINPNLILKHHGSIEVNGKKMVPLSAISNSLSVLSNESGYWPVYHNDSNGFANLKYQNNGYEILLIGDSFGEGYSVMQKDNISSNLIKSGISTYNISNGGNGPLIQYATIKEYCGIIEPKYIIWTYYMNDISDLNEELKNPILKKYLNEDNFSQNLLKNKKMIDNVLRKKLNEEIENHNVNRKPKSRTGEKVVSILKLYSIRKRLGLINSEPNIGKTLDTFDEILMKTKRLSININSDLIFILLPSRGQLNKTKKDPHLLLIKKLLKKNDVQFYDAEEYLYQKVNDFNSLFPFGMDGHYNEKGYKLIADLIKDVTIGIK